MKSFEERLRLAKIVLKQLKKQQLCRTELEKRTIMHCGTSSKFRTIFQYLLAEGFVEKTGVQHRAPYRITLKGLKFLEATTDEQPS